MSCTYCSLPLPPVDIPAGLHPICADEVSDAPLFAETVSSCPNGGCDACNPMEESHA